MACMHLSVKVQTGGSSVRVRTIWCESLQCAPLGSDSTGLKHKDGAVIFDSRYLCEFTGVHLHVHDRVHDRYVYDDCRCVVLCDAHVKLYACVCMECICRCVCTHMYPYDVLTFV